MKRALYIIAGIILAVAVLTYFTVPKLILAMVTDYEPYTFESVLENDTLRVKYGIGDNKDPGDYGYPQFQEVDFHSVLDSVRLNGWFIPAADTIKQCLMLLHGRTSNRLKPMKYLTIFKESGLDSLYHIFIPDLRNSGKSQPAKTYMGYKFAEDIASAALWVNRESGADQFVLYGWSMGAMATMTLMGRDDLQQQLISQGIGVDKIILDCPLSNVWSTLQHNGAQLGVPGFFFERAMNLMERETNNFTWRMKLSDLCRTTEAPVMILASKSDATTPYFVLKEELDQLADRPLLETHLVDSAEHVQIFQSESYHNNYVQWVVDFMTPAEASN